jgi:hypothetical protein
MLREHPAMRQPRVRFTVRRMIFAVGVVGTVIGTGQVISDGITAPQESWNAIGLPDLHQDVS